jgi:rubrerythrin
MLDLNEIEILQVAIAHEERARVFYTRLSKSHGDSPAGVLFGLLAKEEEGHIRRLSAKYGIPAFEAGWEVKYLPYLIDLEKLAWEEGVDAEYAAGGEAASRAMRIARKAEEHAVSFYSRAAEVVEDRYTRGLLKELEAEERVHLARIDGYMTGKV